MTEHKAKTRYSIGLDLGFASDYTALAIVRTDIPLPPLHGIDPEMLPFEERPRIRPGALVEESPRTRAKPQPPTHYLEHVERIPLGTGYPTIAEQVIKLVARPELKAVDSSGKEYKPHLVCDVTGVGRPVVQLIRNGGVLPIAISITGGDSVTGNGYELHVPKRDLVSATQVLLQSRRLRFAPGMPFLDTLKAEFESFKMKIDLSSGHDSYGAWREGQHDDLVLAVALAAWWAETRYGVGNVAPKSFSGFPRDGEVSQYRIKAGER